MRNVIRLAVNVIMTALFAFTFAGSLHVSAVDYGTNFNFKDVKAMEDDGWSISHKEGVSLRADGIVLDGSNGLTVIGYFQGIPPNVKDWKVGATGGWLGGNGHSWLDVQVYTTAHLYVFALDGSSGQYVLLRDGAKVIAVNGYQEAANGQVGIYLEKTGSSISISCNSRLIGTYNEKDQSPVTGVAISSPPQSAALYTWAGAFVPEPSSGGTGGDTPAPPDGTQPPNSNDDQSWANYDPDSASDLIADTVSGVQANPGSSFSFTTQQPTGQIPEPPLPPVDQGTTDGQNQSTVPATTNPPSPNPNEHIWIVMLDGTFSMNTAKPEIDDMCDFVAGNQIFNGVGQKPNVFIGEGSSQFLAAVAQEQHLFETGQLSPETRHEFNPYNGDTPSYYVSGSTHISGDLTNPQTMQSAVAIFTYQVTDAKGNVVYQNKITATASEGKSLAEYWEQAGHDINNYLQSVIKR